MRNEQVQTGMTVRMPDGKKLGTVIECRNEGFIIEKGVFFKKDYDAKYDHIIGIRDGELYYQPGEGLMETEGAREAAGRREDERVAGQSEEARIPLAEEELTAQKRSRDAGQVRVRKEVVTEQKQVTVPVTREEVVVEHAPATGPAGANAFKEQEVTIPLREEEVTVSKRPVVREEVRVRKVEHQEQRTASAETRREEAHVEEERNDKGGLIDRERDPDKYHT